MTIIDKENKNIIVNGSHLFVEAKLNKVAYKEYPKGLRLYAVPEFNEEGLVACVIHDGDMDVLNQYAKDCLHNLAGNVDGNIGQYFHPEDLEYIN